MANAAEGLRGCHKEVYSDVIVVGSVQGKARPVPARVNFQLALGAVFANNCRRYRRRTAVARCADTVSGAAAPGQEAASLAATAPARFQAREGLLVRGAARDRSQRPSGVRRASDPALGRQGARAAEEARARRRRVLRGDGDVEHRSGPQEHQPACRDCGDAGAAVHQRDAWHPHVDAAVARPATSAPPSR